MTIDFITSKKLSRILLVAEEVKRVSMLHTIMILFSARGSLWEATMEHARSSNHGAVQVFTTHCSTLVQFLATRCHAATLARQLWHSICDLNNPSPKPPSTHAKQRIAAHNILAANSMFQQKEVFSDMETSRTYLIGNRSGGRGGGSKGGSSRNLSLYPKGGQEVRQREESRSKSVDFLKETSNRAHSLSPSRSPHRTPFVSHKHVHYIKQRSLFIKDIFFCHHDLRTAHSLWVIYMHNDKNTFSFTYNTFSLALTIYAVHTLCESYTCTMYTIYSLHIEYILSRPHSLRTAHLYRTHIHLCTSIYSSIHIFLSFVTVLSFY